MGSNVLRYFLHLGRALFLIHNSIFLANVKALSELISLILDYMKNMTLEKED